MQSYQEMSKEELLKEKEHLEAEYKKFQQRGLKLDMYHYLRQFQFKYHVRYDFTLHDTRCDGKYAVVQA